MLRGAGLPEFSNDGEEPAQGASPIGMLGYQILRRISALSAIWAVGSVYGADLDLSNLQVPRQHIGTGGVPPDGVPSIDAPKFWSVDRAEKYLFKGDLVMSVPDGETARAYPLRIMTWHEVVNDEIEGRAIAITYCPLCASGMVFSREIAEAVNGRLEFGVSGLLYHSDVVLYDRESLGLWSQLSRKAMSGKFAGRELEWRPSSQMTWQAWKRNYPDGQVLSTEKGFDRPYTQSPYEGYTRIPFPVVKVPTARNNLPMKARIVGIILEGKARAYNVSGLRTGEYLEQIGDRSIRITYDRRARLLLAEDASGESIPVVWSY